MPWATCSSTGDGHPLGISCLSAEEARPPRARAEPSRFLQLPGNADVYALRWMIIDGTGAQCTVRTLQMYGRSESTHSDYSVVCVDGNGSCCAWRPVFKPRQADSCNEAARQASSAMTNTAPDEAPVKYATFKDARAQRRDLSHRADRLVGQKSIPSATWLSTCAPIRRREGVAFIPPPKFHPYESEAARPPYRIEA